MKTRKQKLDEAKRDVLITSHQLDYAERAVEKVEDALREERTALKLAEMNAKAARALFSRLLEAEEGENP